MKQTFDAVLRKKRSPRLMHSRFSDRWIFVTIMLIMVFFSVSRVAGVDGIFSDDDTLELTDVQIVFNVDQTKNTIHQFLRIGTRSEKAEPSGWLVPVPADAHLSADQYWPGDLEELTRLRFATLPPHPCSLILETDAILDPGPRYFGETEIAERVLLDGRQALRWLRKHEVPVPAGTEQLIAEYEAMGYRFLAMSTEDGSGISEPVTISYSIRELALPLRLASLLATDSRIALDVWIFATTQYAPLNYTSATVDLSRLTTPGELLDKFQYPRYEPRDSYESELARLYAAYDGQVFVTQYAHPSTNLFAFGEPDETLVEIIKQYPYLTHLSARLSPQQIEHDPTFVPNPDAPDVTNAVDLRTLIADPFEFWGCSSRTLFPDDLIPYLPSGRTRIDDLQFEVAHPANWQLSKFTMSAKGKAYPFWALAPHEVDRETVDAFFAGKDTGPMFLFTDQLRGASTRLDYSLFDFFQQPSSTVLLGPVDLPYHTERGFKWYAPDYPPVGLRLSPFQTVTPLEYDGILFALLASPDAWDANTPQYTAMLSYAQSFQHYGNADLQHTLFLSCDYVSASEDRDQWASLGRSGQDCGGEFSYPAGWHETGAVDDIIILPEDASDPASVPYLRVIPVRRFEPVPAPATSFTDQLEAAAMWLEETYDVELPAAFGDDLSACGFVSVDLDFETEKRQGWIRLSRDYIMEASAPIESFDTYASLLRTMHETWANHSATCG